MKPVNDVRPFKALLYNPSKIKDIGMCLSQPYDVIGKEQLELYLKQHEYNIVRLTLPKILQEDNETTNRYTRANETIITWRNLDIIRRVDHPSFWAYEQEFNLPFGGRKKMKGFIGLVRLSDYEEMRILPHEKVLKNPVEDRIKLTKLTNTQFEYIWGIYKDNSAAIDKILDSCEKSPPIVDYLEKQFDVRHRFYQLASPDQCRTVSSVMSTCPIYIADGHHRYQTMLTIRDEYRKLYPDAGPDAPWEFIMMFLVNSGHEGLTILPTHRMLHNLSVFDEGKIIDSLKTSFSIEEYPFKSGDDHSIREKWLNSIRDCKKDDHKFGLYLKDIKKYFLLTLTNKKGYLESVPESNSESWKMLDVNIANILFLKDTFGITEEQLLLGEKLKYTQDANEAVGKVIKGEMDAAIILNSTSLEEVMEIASRKEIMPRKSTFFYPKPLSGLVMFSMKEKDL